MYVYVFTDGWIYLCVYVCMCVCMYVCLYVCMYVCMYASLICRTCVFKASSMCLCVLKREGEGMCMGICNSFNLMVGWVVGLTHIFLVPGRR
jgi:hypothetical protein